MNFKRILPLSMVFFMATASIHSENMPAGNLPALDYTAAQHGKLVALTAKSIIDNDPIDTCREGDDLCLHFAGATNNPLRGGRELTWHVGDGTMLLTRFQAWRQMRCLAYAAWAEGRSEGPFGMLAIMQVIANRTTSEEHPDTPCLAIAKKGQFEAMSQKQARKWRRAAANPAVMVPDIEAATKADIDAARSVRILAWRLMTGQIRKDGVRGATFYATRELVQSRRAPKWVQIFQPVMTIGEHVFFRPNDSALPAS